MTNTEYEEICKLTKNIDNLDPDVLRLYLALGLTTEAGEAGDHIKKEICYFNHVLDKTKLKDELGDVLYYLTNLITHYGWSLEEVMDHNSNKVKNVLARRATAE